MINNSHRDTATGDVLHVSGELDLPNAAVLRNHVEQLALVHGHRLVIDLSGLTFCDSSGITTLFAARQHTQAAGADIVLADVPAHTLRNLGIIGLDQVFTFWTGADAL
ncbi:STAS domain-containing protein [Streptomyces sp. NPDC046994]|uniref:STAS domain-containing protein n=1 Tax=Streptomyces sp. NPDC046994 TaxID=3155735 RepID=UPI003452CC63